MLLYTKSLSFMVISYIYIYICICIEGHAGFLLSKEELRSLWTIRKSPQNPWLRLGRTDTSPEARAVGKPDDADEHRSVVLRSPSMLLKARA